MWLVHIDNMCEMRGNSAGKRRALFTVRGQALKFQGLHRRLGIIGTPFKETEGVVSKMGRRQNG